MSQTTPNLFLTCMNFLVIFLDFQDKSQFSSGVLLQNRSYWPICSLLSAAPEVQFWGRNGLSIKFKIGSLCHFKGPTKNKLTLIVSQFLIFEQIQHFKFYSTQKEKWIHRDILNFKVKSLVNLYQNDPLFHLIPNATVIICNTSRFTAVSAVGSRRYSTHKFYMKEKISEIVRDFCDLLLKVKTFQKVSFIKPLFPKRWKHFWKINPKILYFRVLFCGQSCIHFWKKRHYERYYSCNKITKTWIQISRQNLAFSQILAIRWWYN